MLYFYLVLLIGLRYMVGGDSYFYKLYFDSIPTSNAINISWDAEYQPFFSLFAYITKIIYPSFTSFQIFHSIIINTVLFCFIIKNSRYRYFTLFLCLLMFYINFTVEILRESLAIMVFIINYKSFETNKWFRYYIGVFFAIMFHLSAVFLIILPFFKILKLNRTYILILIASFLILGQLTYLFTFLENVDKIGKKVNDYSEAGYGWKSTLLFFITRTLIPVGLLMWAKVKFHMKIHYEALICVFGLLGVLSVFNTIIFTRFTNYLFAFYCISLSDVLMPFFQQKSMNLTKSFVTSTVVVIILCYGYISFYWPVKYYEKWIPYYSIFSSEAKDQKFINRNY
ncbi:EpsG family protein [Mucilaginibacter straminoryzae]|uniref:EpsG family protein n=1 Tax=Mucilaginibacter straminoryzae TaxID=2932774 RepID=UPI003B84A830